MMLRRIALGVLVLFLAGLGTLAWRLDRGPIELPFLAARIEAAFEGGALHVEVDRTRIAWRGFHDGSLAPVGILLSQVRARGEAGTLRLEVPEARVAFPLGGLLRARLAPSRVVLDAPVLHLRREADGTLSLPPGQREGEAASGPSLDSLLAALRDLRINGGRIMVEDRALGLDWALRDLDLALGRPAGDALRGGASATLALGEETVPLRLAASLEEAPQRWHLDLSLPHLQTAALAQAAPVLAPLAMLDAPAALTASTTLTEGFRPLEASAALQAGPGGFALPEAGRVPFSALDLRLGATPRRLRLDRLALTLAPPEGAAKGPTLAATGEAVLAAGRWQAEAALTLDRARLGALDTWWPRNLAPAARGWIAENLTGGLLHDGHWQVAATAPQSLESVVLSELTGGAVLDDVAIRWHPRLPPLENLSGTLAFSPKGITLQARGGHQAHSALQLPEARLRLTDLGAGPLRAELRGRLTGPVSDLWDLLRDPALGLLAGQALPFHAPSGSLDAEVTATVPLAGPSAPAAPRFQVTARVADLRLPDLVRSQALRDGDLDITFDQAGGRVDGSMRLGNVPARATVHVDLPHASGKPLGLRATVTAHAEVKDLAALGLDTGSVVEGPLGLRLDYERQGEALARLTARADLDAAGLSLPSLGYAKPAGTSASAEVALRLDGAALRGIERLQAEAPDLVLRARTATAEGAPADQLEILDGRIGATRFTGRVTPSATPAKAWRVSLQGPVIDLRALLSGGSGGAGPATPDMTAPAGNSAPDTGGAPALALDVRFDRALTPGEASPLRDLQASAMIAGGIPQRAHLQARSGGKASLDATLSPAASGGRELRLEASEVGTMLAALGPGVPLDGGHLTVEATQSGPTLGAPVTGTAELTDFAVQDAPAAAKVLQALTGYGLLEALNGPGLGFARATLPFRFADGVLSLQEARAFSASLGLTTTGRIDLRQRELDLKGTVVPAYVFNSLLGNLPLVGRLFSAEKGGGLFSARFEVHGRISDPDVSVNPLSALTPGFLRGLFDLGEDEPAADDAGHPP